MRIKNILCCSGKPGRDFLDWESYLQKIDSMNAYGIYAIAVR